MLPTIYSETSLAAQPILVDTSLEVDCQTPQTFKAQNEVELTFANGQRWIIFFSRPVSLRCPSIVSGSPTVLQVLDGDSNSGLFVRAALIMKSANINDDEETFATNYATQLRASKDIFPGELTNVVHSFNALGSVANVAKISFSWDPQYMSSTAAATSSSDMIMFALPHHQDLLSTSVMQNVCTQSLLGKVCLVKGTTWDMYENLPKIDFRAPRSPDPQYVPALAEALLEDIEYQIPKNFQIGAGDTYFSGKTLAKLARILLINEELKDICDLSYGPEGVDPSYASACTGIELPSAEDVSNALDQLRRAATVWVKENEHAPFVYDTAWGGVVSCGCLYDNGICTNQFPNCPAFTDQGLNFGNGFYNDHHFHYG
jgi:hypothetical protein